MIIDMQISVSIVGAGPAGFALASDLESHGTRVLVYSHPTHMRHAKHVINKGCLRSSGVIESCTKPRITSDMSEVVEFSRFIFLTVPSTGQGTVLQELRRFDLRQHMLIVISGNLFSLITEGDLEVGAVLETNISPHSCRMNNGELMVSGKKRLVHIAAFHKGLAPTFYHQIESLLPFDLRWCTNVMEVCLSNINGVFHPLMILMNAGRIEDDNSDFLLYHDGLTRSVANAILAVDKVRIEIGEAFGFRMKSVVDVSNECYGQHFTDLVDLAQNSKPHNKLKAPSNMEDRCISEDVQDLLVCWHGLAEKLKIDATPIKAVISLASMANGVDYMKTGRNLRKLGLENTSRSEILKRFSTPPK